VLGNSAKDVERVNADVDSSDCEANQGVVQEYIEPLLIKARLLLEQQRLAAVNQFVFSQMLFEILNNFHSKFEVMGAVA
jgi:hypothetical protein